MKRFHELCYKLTILTRYFPTGSCNRGGKGGNCPPHTQFFVLKKFEITSQEYIKTSQEYIENDFIKTYLNWSRLISIANLFGIFSFLCIICNRYKFLQHFLDLVALRTDFSVMFTKKFVLNEIVNEDFSLCCIDIIIYVQTLNYQINVEQEWAAILAVRIP